MNKVTINSILLYVVTVSILCCYCISFMLLLYQFYVVIVSVLCCYCINFMMSNNNTKFDLELYSY